MLVKVTCVSPHYFHAVNTVILLLRPLNSGPNKILSDVFLFKETKFYQMFSYLKNLFDMVTLLTQPDFYDLLMSGLTGFHCLIIIK